MKYISALSIALLLLAQCVPLAAQTRALKAPPAKVLRNNDVLRLVGAKIPAQVIVETIERSSCLFDTFPPVLKDLQRRGVPEPVIRAMVTAPSGPPASARQTPSPEPPQTVPVTIKDGTVLEVTTPYQISSAEAHEGADISFRVTSPVKVEGMTVIASGAVATARVARAKKSESWGRGGELTLDIRHVVAVDGSQVPLRFDRQIKGDSKGGMVATGAATTAVVAGVSFLPVAPVAVLWAFLKGEEASVPAGARFKITVRGDMQVHANSPLPRSTAYIDATTQRHVASQPPAVLVSLKRESIRRGF